MLSLATLSASAVAQYGQNASPAGPGTVNYIEGQAMLAGHPLNQRSNATIQPGQVLTTGAGKAEILLTPGVFLRIGPNSAVRMVSPDLTYTEVELERGRADVEVDQLYKQNDIVIRQQGVQTQLVETGLYEFNADNGSLNVFEGKAAVFTGDTMDVKPENQRATVVKGGHQFTVTATGKPQGFDKAAAESDDLYKWSGLRSQYLGEATSQIAPYGEAPGWAYAPGLYGYTWLPGDGLFYSPFGYGFYSPFYFGAGFGYGYGYGGYRGGFGGYGARGFASGGFHGGGRR
ncbi:FecR domain-containing protein [Granulicella rosea]|nr:FecR domain-containing protein [Granulicella rosea]